MIGASAITIINSARQMTPEGQLLVLIVLGISALVAIGLMVGHVFRHHVGPHGSRPPRRNPRDRKPDVGCLVLLDRDELVRTWRERHGGRSNPDPELLGIVRPAPPPAPPQPTRDFSAVPTPMLAREFANRLDAMSPSGKWPGVARTAEPFREHDDTAWWRHRCRVERALIDVAKGHECSWCGAGESK
jgi:hypothetical protein